MVAKLAKPSAHSPYVKRWATRFGLTLFAVYVIWNLAWWIQGRAAPSMLTGLTGLPAPTTGGTRSFRALLAGDVATSLYFNPMAAPIVALIIVTIFQIVRFGRAKRWVFGAWVAILSLAWVLKLASPIETW